MMYDTMHRILDSIEMNLQLADIVLDGLREIDAALESSGGWQPHRHIVQASLFSTPKPNRPPLLRRGEE